jgi:hypothetical protein
MVVVVVVDHKKSSWFCKFWPPRQEEEELHLCGVTSFLLVVESLFGYHPPPLAGGMARHPESWPGAAPAGKMESYPANGGCSEAFFEVGGASC